MGKLILTAIVIFAANSGWAENVPCKNQAENAYPAPWQSNQVTTGVTAETAQTISYDVNWYWVAEEGGYPVDGWSVTLRKSDCAVLSGPRIR